MIKFLKKGLFLPLLTLLLLLNSCNLGDSDNSTNNGTTNPPQTGEPGTDVVIELKTVFSGLWDDYGYEKTITENSFGGYAQIVKLVKNEFNGGEAIDSDNYGVAGYAVLKYNDQPNKYGIVRFKSLKSVNNLVTMDYSEGYKKLNPSNPDDWTGIYFSNAAEAEAGMTATEGFFFYSTATKKSDINTASTDLSFTGLWDDFGYEKTITESDFGRYAQVVKLVKDQFNGGEAIDGDNSGIAGYAVLKYYEESSKYGIVRFKSLKSTDGLVTMEYSEGFKKLNPSDPNDWTGIYFSTAAEAEAGMTDAQGFFLYSTGTKK